MANVSKEVLEKYFNCYCLDEPLKMFIDDCFLVGRGCINFGVNTVGSFRLEDVIITEYQKLLDDYKVMSRELRFSNGLEF